jgi:CheY-like chemotaxis protein
MPGGGAVVVETADVTLDQGYADTHGELKPGRYAMIAVSDTGVGIPPDLIVRVFEPFFTTKEVGKGTGLGLSMVYGFAKQSAGHVSIDSEPDHGTTVKLYLPYANGAAPEAAAEVVGATLPQLQGLNVLLVEDSAVVRTMIYNMLTDLGCRVIEAGNGNDALAKLAEAKAEVDLLLTDMVLPAGMNGAEIAAAARARQPSIKVVMMSGYAPESFLRNGHQGDLILLRKPFRKAKLAEALARALGEVVREPALQV